MRLLLNQEVLGANNRKLSARTEPPRFSNGAGKMLDAGLVKQKGHRVSTVAS